MSELRYKVKVAVAMATHYDVLGVSPTASTEEIRAAYLRLAKLCHPDSAPWGDADAFRRIQEAYEALTGTAAGAVKPRRPQAGVHELPRARPAATASDGAWLQGAIGLAVIVAGGWCAFQGFWAPPGIPPADLRPYLVSDARDFWVLVLGVLLLLTGWRIFAHRKRPLASSASVWLHGALGIAVAGAGVWCAFKGDVKGHYNGWLVALGWALLLMGWRIFQERKGPFRNPLLSLRDGIGHAAFGLVGFVLQMVGLAIALFAFLGVMILLERAGLVH